MKILLTNVQLSCGGSETWTYHMARHLIKRGHEVEFFTKKKGIWTEHFEKLGHVHTGYVGGYDLILCNHNSCQEEISDRDCPMIRTCHGPKASEEQPKNGADYYVSVSPEVQSNLKEKGFVSEVVRNGIDPEIFNPTREVKELKKVLFMTDYEENAKPVKEACERMDLELRVIGNFNPIWDTAQEMNDADMIISLGRGAYEGLMMNRAVLIYDEYGDGWLTPSTWPEFVKRNCSGRTNRHRWDADHFEGIFEDWNRDGFRDFAIEKHDINEKCEQYLRIANDLGAKC